ncbi:MAG TPA: serine hydrolase domain-containing protein [Candidatus Sulfotelmatobacter sp.]|nr:serine hydrolase domain-containing protein [Candidatus Sulfotelmatobacter sp.]
MPPCPGLGGRRRHGRHALAGLLLAVLTAGCASGPIATPSLDPGASLTAPPSAPGASGSLLPTSSPAPSGSPAASPSPRPATLPSGLSTDGPLPQLTGLSAALQAQLAADVRKLHLPGIQATILLSDGESWSGAAGFADVEAGRRMTTADVFDVGSITKTFVAADVMRLVETGTLRLDDPLARWVPTYPGAASITIRELLDHTSGLADYFSNEKLLIRLGASTRTAWQPAALLPYVGKPLFAPGTDWAYSNTNYLLLGEVITAATGRTAGADLAARFLGPLSLRSTALQSGTTAAPAPALGPLAHPYERQAGPKVAYRDLADGSGYLPFTSLATSLDAAGSLVSTSADLARWAADLYGGSVLSAPSLAAMEDTSVSAPYKPRFIYGLGAQRLALAGFTSYGHGGACSGYRAAMRYFPLLGASIVVLTNIDGPDPDTVVGQLMALITTARGGPSRA